MMFLAAPTKGTEFRPVSSAPLITPLRRIVPATVATAIAAPIQGSDLDIRRESRAPAQLAIRFVIVIRFTCAMYVPSPDLKH
jgi:hypothetical protein